jgi:archaellum component FlaC
MIRNQMDLISGRIAGIKTQATNARATITQIVEQALKDLYEVVQHKTNILKADRLELAR